jgi:cell division protein FtsL
MTPYRLDLVIVLVKIYVISYMIIILFVCVCLVIPSLVKLAEQSRPLRANPERLVDLDDKWDDDGWRLRIEDW